MKTTAFKNIRYLQVIRASTWFSVSLAVLLPFYQSFGLTVADFFLIQSIFSLAVVVFEFPTGYFADRIGHREALIAGSLCGALSWVMHALSSGFYTLLAAEVVLALAIALRSGADSALLYESMAVAEVTESYKHTENKMNMISATSEATGALLGGFLAAISLVLPFWFRVGVECISCIAAYKLAPMRKVHKERAHSTLQDILFILRYTATHRQLRATILFCAVTGATTLTSVWFIQPYLGSAQVDVYWYGVVWGALNASLVLFAWYAERIEHILGEYRTLLVLTGAPLLAFLTLAVLPATLLAVPIFLTFYFVRSLNSSFGRAYIQEHALDDARASILSVQSLLFRLIFALCGPVIGYIATAQSVSNALVVSGIFFAILSTASLYIFTHAKDNT
jgi:predicted MFS family arabinose efflux permease